MPTYVLFLYIKRGISNALQGARLFFTIALEVKTGIVASLVFNSYRNMSASCVVIDGKGQFVY